LNKAKTRNLPIVECTRCRKRKRTMLLGKMICPTCYLTEPKANCGACGKEKRFVTEGGGICPECIKRTSLPTEIECAGCGKRKRPVKRGGEYCKPCQMRVRCGRGRCSGCGKDRPYIHKTKRLCKVCALNHWAPNRLRTYVKTLRISNEYNLALFRQLVGLINWERVTEEDRVRFYDFGEFLQCHTFEETLTWGSILKLKSELPPAKFRSVRFCLERLGELLLDPAKDDNWEECMNGINPLVPLACLDLDAIAVFKKYDLWLRTERKNTPKARRNHFETLGGFWRWCNMLGLLSLDTVTAAHVEEYLHTLGLKWKCRHCSFTKNLTRRGEAPPTVCENWECRALDSCEKVIRCVEHSVEGHRAALRIFFGWCKEVEGGIEINPAPATQLRKTGKKKRGWRRPRKAAGAIQYYPWEVIFALLNCIQDPKMPAEEAMVLYLLLHHAFFLWELQTVRIPSQCRPTALGAEPPESLADTLLLEFRPRELSRNKQFVGRSGEMLRMEPADEPWLRDLVERFIRERNQKLRDPNYPYLFVGARRSFHGGPVSGRYIRTLVESATARITGRVCTVNILGKCSRVLYAEFGGHDGFQHLRELGLCEQQARSYSWVKRTRVVPKHASQVRKGERKQHLLSLTLPPIDVFGIPTDG
jgi:hypothetical protein